MLRHNADVAAKAMVIRRRQEERMYNPFELAVELLQWEIVDTLIQFGYNLSQHDYLQDNACLDSTPESLRDDKNMLSMLQALARSPCSLQRIVILNVRHLLKSNISEKLQGLPLPSSLKHDIIAL